MEVDKTAEQLSVYLNFVKSHVACVEKLLVDIDQNGIVISDNEMVTNLRSMGRTLQRIFSKWDKIKPPVEDKVKPPVEERTVQKSSNDVVQTNTSSRASRSLFHESFLYDSSKNETPVTPSEDESQIQEQNDRDFADIMRKKFKRDIEDTEETTKDLPANSILRPSRSVSREKKLAGEYLTDSSLKKISENTYVCTICPGSKEMNINNVSSHLIGRQHTNRSQSQENTSNRKTSIASPNDLSSVMLELREKKDGTQYIVNSDSIKLSYYCTLCKVEIAKVEANLIQHLTGQVHKRLCLQD